MIYIAIGVALAWLIFPGMTQSTALIAFVVCCLANLDHLK